VKTIPFLKKTPKLEKGDWAKLRKENLEEGATSLRKGKRRTKVPSSGHGHSASRWDRQNIGRLRAQLLRGEKE